MQNNFLFVFFLISTRRQSFGSNDSISNFVSRYSLRCLLNSEIERCSPILILFLYLSIGFTFPARYEKNYAFQESHHSHNELRNLRSQKQSAVCQIIPHTRKEDSNGQRNITLLNEMSSISSNFCSITKKSFVSFFVLFVIFVLRPTVDPFLTCSEPGAGYMIVSQSALFFRNFLWPLKQILGSQMISKVVLIATKSLAHIIIFS